MPDLEKLRKLADHLKDGKLGHKRFSYSMLNSGAWWMENEENPYKDHIRLQGCGTVGCALGEMPFVFEEWAFQCGFPVFYEKYWTTKISAVYFFNLSERAVEHLFYPNNFDIRIGGKCLNASAAKEDVADNIYHFIKQCEASFEFSFTYSNNKYLS